MDQIEKKPTFNNRAVALSLPLACPLRYRIAIGLLFLISLGFAQTPADFNFYKTITIQTSEIAGSTTHTDFPFLFSTTNLDFRETSSGGHINSTNGYDILFTNSNGSVVLDHQLESYNPVTGQIEAWVKTDLDPTVTNELRIYFGSSTATANTSSTETWDDGYKAVWHLDSNNDDGTSTGADLSNSGSENSINSMIGDAQNFDQGDHLQTGTSNDLNIAGDITLEAWVNLDIGFDDEYANTIISGAGNEAGANFPFFLNLEKTGFDYQIGIYWEFGGGYNSGDFEYVLSSNLSIDPVGSWNHIAITRNNSNQEIQFFVNGEAIGTDSFSGGDEATPSAANHSVRLGRSHEDTSTERMVGKLDEVRISNVVRSPEWMETSFNSMSTPSVFYNLSASFPTCGTTFTYPKSLFCETETHPQASITGDTGGSFTSPDGNITFNSFISGDVNLLTSSKGGPYDIVYTAPDGCTHTEQITINPRPSASDPGLAQTICGTGSATMNAVTPTVGTGMWTVASGGTGSFNDATSPAAVFTPDNIPGNYSLTWTVSNSTCFDAFAGVSISFEQDPTIADAGVPGVVCSGLSHALDGNTPVVGSGIWTIDPSDISKGGSFDDPSLPNAVFTGVADEVFTLHWTITNGSCVSTDSKNVTFQTFGNANAGSDQYICDTSVSLSGNTDPSYTYAWNIISGDGVPVTPSSSSSDINGLTPGTNIIEYSISVGLCSAADQVKILVDSVAPTFTNTILDTTFYFGSTGCNTSYVEGNLEALFANNDTCDPSPSMSFTYASWIAGCGNDQSRNVTVQIEDAAGNTASHSFTVSEKDTTPPTFITPRDTIINTCNTDLSTAALGEPTGLFDNCSTPSFTLSESDTSPSCTGERLIIREWTVQDQCGNIATSTQTITLVDNTDPSFTQPVDTIIYRKVDCTIDTFPITGGPLDVLDESDDCSTGLQATYTNLITNDCIGGFTMTRRWRLVDDCNNDLILDQFITVLDTFTPTFTTPSNITVYLDLSCGADTAATASQAGDVLDEWDNCSSGIEATYVNNIDAAGACGSGYVITRTWTLEDNCGNSISKDQIITVEDTIAPMFTVPSTANIYLDINCNYDADSSIAGAPTAIIDNCPATFGDPTISDVLSPGTCEGELTITRTWTMADICGNSRSYNQIINIIDTINPTFTTPSDTSLYLNNNCDPISTTINLLGDVTDEDDNCTTSLDATYSDVTTILCGSSYQVIRTWSLTDNCGNNTTTIQTINVLDTIQPTYTIPIDVTLYQDGNCRADTSFVGTGGVNDEMDNCSNGLIAIYRDSVVTPVCLGSYTVYRIWELEDECNNVNRQIQVITVLDQVAPTFFTPQNDTLYVDNSCYADTTLAGLGNIISVLENCSSLDTAYTDVPTLLCEGSYRLLRTWTLTDECGNSTSRDQIIVILDTISPSFTPPRDTTIHLAVGCAPNLLPVLTGDVIDESDNCTTTLDATYSDSSTPGCGSSEVIFRTWSLTDACGNSISAIQTISVVDTVAPSFTAPADITVYKSNNCTEDIAITVTGDVTNESDFCPGVNQATFSDTQTVGSCSGEILVQRLWTVTDACGNSTSRNQIITIADTTRPYFILPSNQTVYVDASCVADTAIGSTGTVTAAGDNCDLSPSLSFSQVITNNSCIGSYDIERTWNLEDICGNVRTGTQVIQVRDNIAPTLSAPADQTIYIGGGTSCSDVTSIGFESGYQSWVQGGAHCDLESQFPNSGSNSVRLQNSSSSSLITSPVLNLSSYSQAYINFSYYVANMNDGEAFEVQVSDNGGAYSVLQSYIAGSDFSDGNRYNPTVAIPASLYSPNIRIRFRLFGSSNAEQIFIDDIAISGCVFDDMCTSDTSVGTMGSASAASDNCSGAHIPTFSDIVEATCGNTFITRRVWTVQDDCGNISTATQTIEVLDTVSPEMIIPEDLILFLDNTCTPIDTTTTGTGNAIILGDNCDPNPALTYSDSFSNQCGQQLTINRLWTIGDICGNRRSATQIIEIRDTISPVLNGIPSDTHFQCATPDAAPSLYSDITADDVCDPSVVITLSESSTRTYNNSCSDVIYTITRTWTATDACGNSSSQTQNITASCECCNNGIDDDGDGSIDETDTDCPCTTSILSLNCTPSYYYFIPSVWGMSGSQYSDPSRLVITTPIGTANYTIRTADGTTFNQTRSVTQGTADEITLNTSLIQTSNHNTVEDDRGFIIESDQALQVLYQLDAQNNKLLITYKGEEALGQRFRAGSQTHTCNISPNRDDENHFISVMAAEDNTEVTFEFDMVLDGITSPHTVFLDEGETYIVKDEARANVSVTGALITADRPIAVVSGSQHTKACTDSNDSRSTATDAAGRDGGADQLVPTCLLGQEHVVVRGSGNDYSNYAIIVGVTASTSIYLNGSGTAITTVGPGEYFEYELTGSEGTPHYIRTDRPVYVYHVGNLSTNNEVGMALASPLGDCRGEGYIEFTEFSGSTNGANVLIPTSALLSLEINGAAYSTLTSVVSTSTIPGLPTYTSVTIPNSLINPYNTLEADEPFIAAQYVGVNGATGTYGYLTSFKDEVVITNPSTGVSDFNYSLDTLCGGIVFNHCVDATSCAGGQYITDVIPGPHTADVFFDPTSLNTCFSYIGESGYDGFDEITVYVADAYGLITAICVDIYLCGSSPFIETIPADTLIMCDAVIPAPPVFIPVNTGCSQSYNLDYSADSTVTYNSTCTDYAFTITRSWRLTDNCGNDTTVYQNITIADTIDPYLVVPPDTIIYADGLCALDTLTTQLGEAEDIADNCDPVLAAVYTDSVDVNATCSGSFIIVRKWSLIDDCGNLFTNNQRIEIRDTINPTFTVPPDTTVYVNNMCQADTASTNTGVPIDALDNCDLSVISTYSDTSSPGCTGSYTLTRTWTVTDDCGNLTTDIQLITVRDTTGPIVTTPSDTTLYFGTSCSVDTSITNLGVANPVTDNCEPIIIPSYRDSIELNCDRSYTTFRIWEAIDNCGNKTTAIQTIVVADTMLPTMTMPRDTTIYKQADCSVDTTTIALGVVINESDNCSLPSSLQASYNDVVTQNCNEGYTIARTWTLIDGCGNTAVQIQSIVVADTSAPTYSIPRDTILYVNLSCNTNTSISITGQASNILDNCDSAPISTYRDEITTYCIGQYDVFRIWSFTDDCGNIALDTQLISVLDTLPPEYITPSNVTLYSDVNCYADTSLANTGMARFENDNCDLTLTPTYYDSLGMGCGIGYEVFRKWSVADDCGNNFQTTQVITILDLIDPTFSIPSDTILYVDALCFADTTIASTGDVTDEMDNCDATVDAIYVDAVVINCQGGYTFTRIWTVQDDCGNGVSQVQMISVRDTTAPLFTVPRDTIIYSSNSCVIDTLVTQIGDVTDESDACDTSLEASYRDEITTPCEGNVNILRIWSLTDDCGNITIDTQAITVLDTISPSFSIPRDTILYTNISCSTDVSIGSTGDVLDENDNCDTSLDALFVDSRVDGCDGSYVITRAWELTDDCGNRFGGDQIITVRDTIAPTFTTPADVTLYYNSSCLVNTTPVNTGDITDENDGCDAIIDATHIDNIVTGCGNNYVLTRTWNAEDDCGNTYSRDQVITVLDTLPPNYTLPGDVTLYVDNSCFVDTNAIMIGLPSSVADNCGGAVQITYGNTILSTCQGSFEILRAWRFTDVCNNTVIDTQRISVMDTISPSFVVPIDVVLYKGANCLADTSIVANGVPTSLSDNCTTVVNDISYTDITSSLCEGALSIIRRWTVQDDCGNTTIQDQSIEVRDTLAPTFTVPRDTTISLSTNCTVDVTPASLGDVVDENDNCDTSLDATYSDVNSIVCGSAYDIIRSWILTDDCGNIQTGVQTIHVVDTTKPIVAMPSDPMLYKDGLCSIDTTVVTLGRPTATDNCSRPITINYNDIVTSSCEGSMDILRVWTISDPCMNTVIDTQYISVSDTTRPGFTTPIDLDIYVNALCIVDTTVANTGDILDESDNCDTSLDAVYTDAITNNCTGDYSIQRTWTLQDDCGNIHSATQLIHVRDTISPDFSVPRDTTLFVDNLCQSDTTLALIGDVIDESDNCSSGIEATYSDLVVSGCLGSYTMNRTWTLQDDCGNTTSKIQVINLVDTLRPTLTVPSDTVAFMNLTCDVDTMPLFTGTLTAFADNCDASPIIGYTDAIATDCGNTFTITRTWSVSDECGNTQSENQIIQVFDTLNPSFNAPTDITIYKDSNCNHDSDVLVTGDVIDENDNCNTSLEATFIDANIPGCEGESIITRVWLLEDLCGNIARDTQLITVLDTISPTFTIPADITLFVNNMCLADTTIFGTGDVTDENDNCTTILNATYSDVLTNNCQGGYTIQRTWSLADNCGNTTTDRQTISIIDNTAPSFTIPRDTTIYMTATCSADTTVLGTGDVTDEMDGCDSTLDAVYTDVVNVACQNSFTITRNWRLTDDCNNVSIGVQTISVLDTVRPSFSTPADTILYKDASCLFNADPSIAGDVLDEGDNCDTSLDATYVDTTTSSCEGEIIITRIWTLVDDCGNIYSDNQTISILDTLMPSFTTPADITLYVNSGCNVTTDIGVTGDVNDETDNCDTSLNATFSDSQTNVCSGNYIIERAWFLEDDCGNILRDTQRITVLDTINPTFTIPADITLNVDGSCSADLTVANTGDVTDEADNCSIAGTLDATFIDTTIIACIGSYSVQRTWTLSDGCGNNAHGTQIISVVDNTPPSFAPPNDTIAYIDTLCMVNILPVQTGQVVNAMDGCDTSIVYNYADLVTPTCGGSYTITRTWTLSDACSNSSMATQTIIVLDTIRPTFTIPSDTVVYKNDNCLVDITPASLGDVVDERDNCDNGLNATYTDIVNINCEGTSEITRQWTLIDACGNTRSADQSIIIRDTIAPSFTIPADITIYKDLSCNQDNSVVVAGDVTDESDNCSTSIQATYIDDVTNTCIGSQTIRRTWTLVDNCGNQYAAEQNIIVLDTFAPSFARLADVTLYAEITCALDTSAVSTGEPTALDDNCSAVMATTYVDVVVEVCPGTFTIERSWSVSDVCGNTSMQVQSISVLDTLSPIFSPPADATVYASNNCIADTSTVNTGLVLRDSVQECQPDVIIDYTDNIITICGGSYTLERTWEVSDLCGNTRNGTQTITVLDTTAPLFTTPIDTLLFVDDMCYADTTIVSTGNVTAITDGCDNIFQVEYIDRITGSCDGSYVIERTWLVSDQCDNTAASIQIINVQDTLAPNFDPPTDISVFLDSLNLVDTSLSVVGNVSNISDNCSNDLEISYRDSLVEIMSNQVAFESYRLWTIKDQCGNARTLQQLIGFLDTIPPSYSTPPITQVDCEFIPPPDTLDFNDINGVVDITMTEVIVDTPCIDRYTIVRTWTATDAVGNQTSVDRVIHVTTCNTSLTADISNTSPCVGEFVSLNSSFSHPTIPNYSPRWFFRQQPTDLWTVVPGGNLRDVTFPAYEFRSGEYKVIYASQPDHLDPDDCHYHSHIISLNVSGEQNITHRDASICEGETYTIGNSTFFAEGDYNIIYPNATGCDSIVTLHLSVLKRIAQTSNIAICSGEYFEISNGTRYDQTGTYFDSLTNVNNCDSITVINLTVAPVYQDTFERSICLGDTYDFNGRSLSTPGLFVDTLQSLSSCDSIVSIDLSIIDQITNTESVTICTGNSYAFDGYLLYQDTIWQKSFTSVSGCDSLVTLELSVVDNIVSTLFDTTCYQQSYTFGNLTLVQSGVYRDTLTSKYGCDSIIELNFHMRDEIHTSFDIQLCAGETYDYKNNNYSQSFTDIINLGNGCDSIITFNLVIGAPQASNIDIPLCAGDSILIGSNYIKSSGTYTSVMSNALGCLDSSIVYNISVIDAYLEEQTVTLCAGDSLLIDGLYMHTSGDYQERLQSLISGCDSTVITHLIIEDVIELSTEDINVCLGESFTIVVDGKEDLSWTRADLLSCDNCPNPSGNIDQTTTFTASTEGCADQQLSIDVTVTVFNEVQIEVLTPDTVLTYGESVLLDAFVTDPFTQITWYDQFGQELCSNCTSIEVTPESNTFYYAEANGDSGCTVSDTVRTDIKDACAEGEITVPNFISPNGDGVNDDVRVRYNAIRSINKMRIFNRWGQLVFSTDDIDNDRWDGMVKGVPANPGVYVYFIEYQCLNGDEVFHKGSITVLK